MWRLDVLEILEQAGDDALLVAIARRDRAALAEVYRRHAGRCYDLAQRLLRSRADADTVTEALFVELWHHPERFRPGLSDLETRLVGATHRRGVEQLRARDSFGGSEPPGDADCRHQDVVHPRVADQVAAAVAMLTEDERAVIELAYFQGRTYPSIADGLGLSTADVIASMRTGLDHLGGLDARVTQRSARVEGSLT